MTVKQSKMLPIVLLFVIWFTASEASEVINNEPSTFMVRTAESLFEEFIAKYERKYPNKFEKQVRFSIFKDNLEKADSLNKGRIVPAYGITQFMDLRAKEFSLYYTGLADGDDGDIRLPCCGNKTDSDIEDIDVPESFDWREHNVVTEVKNQGACGSCYAFSAVGNIEGQYAIKHKELVSLSAQQIVDCCTDSQGCCGGFMSNAIMNLKDRGGIHTEEHYRYDGYRHTFCSYHDENVRIKIDCCDSYSLKSQEKLKQLLFKIGPISIGIDANNLNIMKGHIVGPECWTGLGINHAVLLVGYGTDPEFGDYWIIKNSWGTTFAEDGYFRIERGDDKISCGMMNDVMTSATLP